MVDFIKLSNVVLTDIKELSIVISIFKSFNLSDSIFFCCKDNFKITYATTEKLTLIFFERKYWFTAAKNLKQANHVLSKNIMDI